MEVKRFNISLHPYGELLIVEQDIQGIAAWEIYNCLGKGPFTIYKSGDHRWWENGVGYTETAKQIGEHIEQTSPQC